MQTLSEIPELVTCFPYNPKPRLHRDGKQTSHAPRQLVMELMEARLGSPAPADCIAMLCAVGSAGTTHALHTSNLCSSSIKVVRSIPHSVVISICAVG